MGHSGEFADDGQAPGEAGDGGEGAGEHVGDGEDVDEGKEGGIQDAFAGHADEVVEADGPGAAGDDLPGEESGDNDRA